MTLVTMEAPGSEGKVTDRPATSLQIREAVELQDVVEHDYYIEERKGFAEIGDQGVGVGDVISSWRSKYLRAGATRTIVGFDTGASHQVYIVNPTGGGTSVNPVGATTPYLWRTRYRDMDVICGQNGQAPIWFYGGKAFSSDGVALGNYTTDQSIITATSGTWASAEVDRGAFIACQPSAPDVQPLAFGRIGERISSTVMSIEGMQSSGSGSHGVFNAYAMGLSWPCVSIYDVGTLSRSGTTITGVGTKWDTGDLEIDTGWLTLGGDALLVYETSASSVIYGISSVTNDTTIAVGAGTLTIADSAYEILRRCPFTEAESHKESLWGTGVKQHPSRVYVSPTGWDPAFPPYLALLPEDAGLYDPESNVTRTNVSDFKLGFVDVPAAEAGDPIEALLSTSGPLLAIGKNHPYQINGVYGSLNVSNIEPRGAGCIDKRSAVSVEEGQFWAGYRGIWWYRNGGMTNLVKDRIENEWRLWVDGFDSSTDYIVSLVAHGYLVIGGKIGTDSRCYAINLETRAIRNVSNVIPRSGHTSRIDGEKEKALFSDTEGVDGDRVYDLAPAFDQSGPVTDPSGSGPKMKYHGPSNLADYVNIKRPQRIKRIGFDLAMHDSDGPGSDAKVEVVSDGQVNGDGSVTTELPNIESELESGTLRRMRRVGRLGRWHQIRFEKIQTRTTQVQVCLKRIIVDLHARGREI